MKNCEKIMKEFDHYRMPTTDEYRTKPITQNAQIKKEIKHIFRNGYDHHMKSSAKKRLRKLGIVIDEDGTHYHLLFEGSKVVIAKTPSDIRSGRNNAAMVLRTFYR